MTDHDSKANSRAEEPSNAEILRAVQKVSEKVGKIETALYGTGNPHGGLFQQFATLNAKVDGMDKSFDRIFSFAKWTVGGLFVVFAVPIFLKSSGRLSKKG